MDRTKNTFHICTYFDFNFLPRGLALYDSIRKHNDDFIFYVLVFDEETYTYLIELQYENLVVISPGSYNSFFSISPEKFSDRKQYYFSATPNLCLYIFERFGEVEELLYLDADTYVTGSLETIYTETGSSSIAFCPHRFHPVFKFLSKNYGYYNVGVNLFKRDETGIKCLKDWQNDCNSWYPGKPGYPLKFFSDQIFLDNWPGRYQNIKIIDHPGINAAPWNIGNYKITLNNSQYMVENSPLVIYHFSSLKKTSDNSWNGNTIFFFGTIKGRLMDLYREYISLIESYKLENSQYVLLNHKNSMTKRVFYFLMQHFLNEKINM